MRNDIPAESFRIRLADAARGIGAHSIACMRMDNPELRRRIEANNARVAEWLQAGLHGEMNYLERLFPAKSDPWSTFRFARSVIVLTFTNRWGDPAAAHPFPPPPPGAPVGYISAYARERDYHAVGHALLTEFKELLGEVIRGEAAVDTQPVYERLFAAAGGLGVIGGNDLLRVPDRTGVRVFIGCLFVDAELPELIHQPAMPFACDTCRACIRNCPTGAITFGRPIDARICISYLTIEKRSLLTLQEEQMIGDWIFGCDECTTVCPPRDRMDTRIPVDLDWLLKTPAAEVRRLIDGTAMAYGGVTQLRKNAVVVLKNMETPRAHELLQWTAQNTGSDLIRQQIAL